MLPSSETNSQEQTNKPPVLPSTPPAVTSTINNGASGVINLERLGTYLDGWADLVEGMGEKANSVRVGIVNQLQSRNMPEIVHNIKTGYANLGQYERREFVISETIPGIKTTISIRQHGKDLYVAWRTWIARVVNWGIIIGISIGAFGLGALLGGYKTSSDFWGNSQSYFSFSGWLLVSLGILVLEIIVIGTLGRIIKDDFFNYFFQQITFFDSDDVSALSLSVHKTILRVLDNTGIDVSKLRIKQNFTGGRKGEDL